MNDGNPDELLQMAGSNPHLKEFLNIPVETRTFPACLVEPVAMEPLRSAPAAAGGKYSSASFWYAHICTLDTDPPLS